jgi:hypothetical protein
MSEFDVDEVMPHTNPVTNPSQKPVKRGVKFSKMAASAKDLKLPADTVAFHVDRATGELDSGYDYEDKYSLGKHSVINDTSHFEELHSHATELEHHTQQHEHFLKSNDLDKDTRASAQTHVNNAYNSLALFHNNNSMAMTHHLKGDPEAGSFLRSGTDHLISAVNHLKLAHAAVGVQAHPLVTNVAAKAASVMSSYIADNKIDMSPLVEGTFASANKVAKSKDISEIKRPPLLNPSERSAQQAEMAAKRSTEPKTVVGKEQLMMGSPVKNIAEGPAPKGQSRTPSGGFAPTEAIEGSEERSRASQAESTAADQERMASMEAQANQRFSPRNRRSKGNLRRRGGQRKMAFAAQLLSKASLEDPQRNEQFKQQQATAAESTQRFIDSKFKSVEARQARSRDIATQQRQTVQGHIDSGDLSKAAVHHVITIMGNDEYKAPARYNKAKSEALNSPLNFLSKQGYDLPQERPSLTGGRLPKRSSRVPEETRKPTTATTSPFTPQAAVEYTQKLAALDAEKATPKRRSNAFTEGQAK